MSGTGKPTPYQYIVVYFSLDTNKYEYTSFGYREDAEEFMKEKHNSKLFIEQSRAENK